MTNKKQQALQLIYNDLEAMSGLILQQLRDLDNVLSVDDMEITTERIEQFRAVEGQIDRYELKISDDFINTICLYNPVASELRRIIACYRISINLERIGDIALKVLKILSDIKMHSNIDKYIDVVSHMLTLCNDMVEKSIISFLNKDIEFAIWTLKNDDVVDKINRKMIRKMIKKSQKDTSDPQTISNFISIKTVVSNIERIADHATNIAEATIYYLKGEDVRHTKLSDVEKSLDDDGDDER